MKRRFRFSIRATFGAFMVCSFLFAWYAVNRQQYLAEQRLIDQMKLVIPHGRVAVFHQHETLLCIAGSNAFVHREPASIAAKISTIASPRVFQRVTSISLQAPFWTDDVLPIISQFPHLEEFECTCSGITEMRLEEFRKANDHLAIIRCPPNMKEATGSLHAGAKDDPFADF